MPDTERICCAMCGWWRTIKWGVYETGEAREVRFDKVDPETAPMWRRERLKGAGRGSRDATIETLETKGLQEMPDEMKDQIRTQCQRILAALDKETGE